MFVLVALLANIMLPLLARVALFPVVVAVTTCMVVVAFVLVVVMMLLVVVACIICCAVLATFQIFIFIMSPSKYS